MQALPCSRQPESCLWEARVHLEVQQEGSQEEEEEERPFREKARLLAEGPGGGEGEPSRGLAKVKAGSVHLHPSTSPPSKQLVEGIVSCPAL